MKTQARHQPMHRHRPRHGSALRQAATLSSFDMKSVFLTLNETTIRLCPTSMNHHDIMPAMR